MFIWVLIIVVDHAHTLDEWLLATCVVRCFTGGVTPNHIYNCVCVVECLAH